MSKLSFLKTTWVLVLIFFTANLKAQPPVLSWAKSVGGADVDQATAMTVDALGNVYTVGNFTGNSDFDPGPGNTNFNAPVPQKDVFITKVNAAGNLVWARQLAGTGYMDGLGITVDAAGHVYATGCFRDTADFDPGPGVQEIEAVETDIFMCKLDANGSFVWAKKIGSYLFDNYGSAFSIAADAAGNVYSMGYFKGIVDFDPGPGNAYLTSNGLTDLYVAKYNPSGDLIWARQMGGSAGAEDGRAMALDAAANIYVAGHFYDTADFDPGPAVYNLATSDIGDPDVFVVKLDSGGQFVWARQMGSTAPEQCFSVAVDGSGNVYTTGLFAGTSDFDPGTGNFDLSSAGGSDVFVSKLDASGNFVWAKQLPGGVNFNAGYGIAVDVAGNVYTTGGLNGNFDPWGFTLIPEGVFLNKLDASGNQEWHYEIPGNGNEGRAVYVDIFGNIYTTGSFATAADFDPGPAVTNLAAAGMSDVFLHKMRQSTCSPSAGTVTTAACEKFVLNGQLFTESGTYSQTILNGTGCDSTITLNLTIDSVVNATASLSGTLLNASPAGTNVSYQWIDCDDNNAPIPGATSQNYTPGTDGNYAVIVTRNSCRDTSGCVTVTGTSSIAELAPGNRVQLYPNPATGLVHLQTDHILYKARIRLLNVTGQVLQVRSDLQGHRFDLDISPAAAGMYFIEVTEGERTARLRLIKQ